MVTYYANSTTNSPRKSLPGDLCAAENMNRNNHQPATPAASELLGELQLTIMECLWDNSGCADMPTIRAYLETHVHKLAYTTVATELHRLEAKGLLQRDATARPAFLALVPRQGLAVFLCELALSRVVEKFGTATVDAALQGMGFLPPRSTLEVVSRVVAYCDFGMGTPSAIAEIQQSSAHTWPEHSARTLGHLTSTNAVNLQRVLPRLRCLASARPVCPC